MRDRYVSVYLDNDRVIRRRRPIMAPGEMEEIKLTKAMFERHPGVSGICIKVEEV